MGRTGTRTPTRSRPSRVAERELNPRNRTAALARYVFCAALRALLGPSAHYSHHPPHRAPGFGFEHLPD